MQGKSLEVSSNGRCRKLSYGFVSCALIDSATHRLTDQIHRSAMSRNLRLVVMGILGRTPLAGVSWQVLHFLEGFRRLGYDVYYIEDTGGWAYNPLQKTHDNGSENTHASNCQYAVNYVAQLMSSFGLQDRWAYRSRVDGRVLWALRDAGVALVRKRRCVS